MRLLVLAAITATAMANDPFREKYNSVNLDNLEGHKTPAKNAYFFPSNVIRESLSMIEALSADKRLRTLFEADSGVWENYSIKEHSLRVFEILNRQYPCQISLDFEKKMSERLGAPLQYFFKATMALHDIGKPLAIKAGKKSDQHIYTAPILEKEMMNLGFVQKATQLAVSLMDNDVIGDLLRSKTTLDRAVSNIAKLARKNDLSPSEYLNLQTLFYVSDAASYPKLYSKVFHRNEYGCLEPRRPDFWELKERAQLLY